MDKRSSNTGNKGYSRQMHQSRSSSDWFTRSRYLVWCQMIMFCYTWLCVVGSAPFAHPGFESIRSYLLFFIWKFLYIHTLNITNETLAQALRADLRQNIRQLKSSNAAAAVIIDTDSNESTIVSNEREMWNFIWRCSWIGVALICDLAYVILAFIKALSSDCGNLCGPLSAVLITASIIASGFMFVLNIVLLFITIMNWIALTRIREKQ